MLLKLFKDSSYLFGPFLTGTEGVESFVLDELSAPNCFN